MMKRTKPGDAVTNTLGQGDLGRETQFTACPVNTKTIFPADLHQAKAHQRRGLLVTHEVTYEFGSTSQGEGQWVGNVQLGRGDAKFVGDGVEVGSLSDWFVAGEQVGSPQRLLALPCLEDTARHVLDVDDWERIETGAEDDHFAVQDQPGKASEAIGVARPIN